MKIFKKKGKIKFFMFCLSILGCLSYSELVLAEDSPSGPDVSNSVCCEMPATHVVAGKCCNGPNDANGQFSSACCEGGDNPKGTVKTVNGKKICCKNKNAQPS